MLESFLVVCCVVPLWFACWYHGFFVYYVLVLHVRFCIFSFTCAKFPVWFFQSLTTYACWFFYMFLRVPNHQWSRMKPFSLRKPSMSCEISSNNEQFTVHAIKIHRECRFSLVHVGTSASPVTSSASTAALAPTTAVAPRLWGLRATDGGTARVTGPTASTGAQRSSSAGPRWSNGVGWVTKMEGVNKDGLWSEIKFGFYRDKIWVQFRMELIEWLMMAKFHAEKWSHNVVHVVGYGRGGNTGDCIGWRWPSR